MDTLNYNEAEFDEAMRKGHNAAWDMEWKRAAVHYKQALDAAPGNLQALSNLASALFELRDFVSALVQYQQVINVIPQDPIPTEKISQIYEVLGNRDLGANYAFNAAELYLKSQDVKKAVENWERCAILKPTHLRARSRLAMTYERQGIKEKAVQEYIAVASLLQQTQSKDRALELAERAIALLPESEAARHALGLLRANQPLPLPAHKDEDDHISTWLPDTEEIRQLTAPGEEVRDEPDQNPIEEAKQIALVTLADLVFDQGDLEETSPDLRNTNFQAMKKGTGPLAAAHAEHSQIMVHLSQAVDHQMRGENDAATRELELAVESGLDNGAAFYNLGYLRYQEGRLETALRHFQRSVNHPKYTLASRILWGQALHQLNRVRDASVQYLEALRIADAMMVDSDQADDLRQMYEPLIEAHAQEKNETVHLELCNAILRILTRDDWRNQIRQARKQLPSQSPIGPPMPLAEILTQAESSKVVESLSRINELIRDGYHRIAMEEAFRTLDYAPTYLHLHTMMGEMLLQQDRVQDAINKFNVVARAYSGRGKSGRSINLYRRITQLAPLDLPARYQLIDLLTVSGQIEETIKEYIELANVYYRLAEMEKARETYQRALNVVQQSTLDPSWTIKVLHFLADIDMQRLDWRRAMRIYDQIRTIDASDMKAVYNVIGLSLRLGENTKAFSELGNSIAQLNQNGKQKEAVGLLEELLTNYPDQVPIRRLLATQLLKIGKQTEAIIKWDEIADQLYQQGDRDGAIQAVQAIIDIGPENVDEYKQALKQLIDN